VVDGNHFFVTQVVTRELLYSEPRFLPYVKTFNQSVILLSSPHTKLSAFFGIFMRSVFILIFVFAIALSACAPGLSGRDVSSGEVCVSDNLENYCKDRNGNVVSRSTGPRTFADN